LRFTQHDFVRIFEGKINRSEKDPEKKTSQDYIQISIEESYEICTRILVYSLIETATRFFSKIPLGSRRDLVKQKL